MSWLKKIGTVIVKGAAIAAGFGPLISATVPGSAGVVTRVTDTLQQLVGIVVNVEAVGQVLGTPGPDKLKAATPLVAQIILQSDFMVGKKIKNQELFQKAAAQFAGGAADFLNSLEDDVEELKKVA
jgi:hypothetical protein